MTTLGLMAGAAALGAVLAAGPAAAQAPGEEWEYSGTTEMMGMKMAMPPTRACVRPGAGDTPPVDRNCEVKDAQVRGNTTSFRIVCGPPMSMQGAGEFTRRGDRSEGRYTMKSSEAEMTVTMNGRRLGACTP